VARSVGDEIETLCTQRHTAWAAGDAEKAKRLGEQLDALYAEKRQGEAAHGSARARKAVERRDNANRELDRLMQP
jgi:hypothetical protein